MHRDEQQRLENAALAAWDAAGERSRAAERERISQARTRAIVGIIVGIVIAAGLSRKHPLGALVPAVVAVLLLVALVGPPERLLAITRLLKALGDAVGRLAAWVFLSPVYLLVVFPLGLLRRLRGHDPLDRRGPSRATYWKKHAGRGSSERTF